MTEIMKRMILIFCIFPLALFGQEVSKKPAYALFDDSGKKLEYGEMLRELSAYDVVFLGEIHDCPIAHWMEFEIIRSLYEIHGDELMLGAEMLEADNQLILDEYMGGMISPGRFEAEARLWDNYATDYRPLLRFAKERGIPFIATNVPRRYANAVKNSGLAVLDALSAEAKKYMAPLPIPFEYDAEKNGAVFESMQSMGGKSGTAGARRFAEAQAVKDATMAWFIARNIRKKFVHINGNYHTESRGGIIPYLERYRPATTLVTLVTVRQETLKELDTEHRGKGDFYICVPETMPRSY